MQFSDWARTGNFFRFLKRNWITTLIFCFIFPGLVLMPEESEGAKLKGKIAVRPVKKSDENLWEKHLDHPLMIGSREFKQIMWNLYFSKKLSTLWEKPERIFDKKTIDLTSEPLRKKLAKIGSNEIVHFSLKTPSGRTAGNLFVFNKTLSWRFKEINGMDYLMDHQSVAQEYSGEILVNWRLAPQKNQDYFYSESVLGFKTREEVWITVPLKSRKGMKPKRERTGAGREVDTPEDPGIKTKLRLLKELREENLISEEDYQKKVEDLLGEF